MLAIGYYFWRFYPQQQMPIGISLGMVTPEPEKYHNDCLHPCVREFGLANYVMVQSPYYAWENKVENPMFYQTNSLRDWGIGTLLVETPQSGFNSDPNVFVEDSLVYVFWRAVMTPLCKEKSIEQMVFGGKIVNSEGGDSLWLDDVQTYISNSWTKGDVTQCPILMKLDGRYLFYTVWYQYEPIRKNKGIVIWEGTSLEQPNFKLVDTIVFDNPLVCDKLFQKKIGNRILFFPIPKRYDLWHFDLFEYNGKLFIVSCAEKDDNIMLSVSTDWKHFKTCKKPLVNNHYSENYTGYRQYYYKPTAIIQDDSLFLFYTANDQEDPKKNQLFLSVKAMKDLMN